MTFIRPLLFALVAASSVTACANPDHDEASHAHAAPPSAAVSAQPQHGGHDPSHGGIVMMDPKHHVEIVLGADTGRHHVYVSDEARAPLPASTFDEVTLTVAGEQLRMSRTPDDTAWQAAGKPVPTTGSKVSIAYARRGEQIARFDDLPIEYVLTGTMPQPAPEPAIPHGAPGHRH